jgi:hypothetical protein
MLIETHDRRINLRQDKTKDTYDLNMGFIKKYSEMEAEPVLKLTISLMIFCDPGHINPAAI